MLSSIHKAYPYLSTVILHSNGRQPVSRQQVAIVPPIDFYSRVFNSRNQQAEITLVCLFILSFVSFLTFSDSSSFFFLLFLLALCSALFDSRWSYQRFVLWGIKNLSFPHPNFIGDLSFHLLLFISLLFLLVERKQLVSRFVFVVAWYPKNELGSWPSTA